MKWRVINKSLSTAPTSGTYRQWKSQLATEAELQCVYCCIHESRFGGLRNFHVEHYKPQSKFPDLENRYENLLYACGICNVFKSNDWPGEHQANDYSKPTYPNPTKVDYGDFLTINANGFATSEHLTGRYVIERLHLNRPQIVGLRILVNSFARIEKIQSEIQSMLDADLIDQDDQSGIIKILIDINRYLLKYSSARPYGADQITR